MRAQPASVPFQPTLLWHDYETFGRDPRRDPPAQFAAIRTDLQLNPIGEPISAYCKPWPDWLPDPEACLLTGITPQHAEAHGVSEPAFADVVEHALSVPGTIGIGYNSLRFDDEVTRFLLWRTLRDPYAREWGEGRARWDLLDTVRTMYALRPEGLNWPHHEQGRVSLKLTDLTEANGIGHVGAHDALSDVRATVDLARLVRRAQPRLWAYGLKLLRKEAVLDEIGVNRPFVHVSGRYPANRGFLAVVWPMAAHPFFKNEVIVWDLTQDPRTMLGLTPAQMRERLFTPTSDLPEGLARLPIKTIHINRAPWVMGDLRVLSPEVQTRWGIDMPAIAKHAEHAAQVAAQLEPQWAEVFKRDAPGADEPAASALYQGLPSKSDLHRFAALRAQWASASADSTPPVLRFADARSDELIHLYIARHAPQFQSADARQQWQHAVRARLEDPSHPRGIAAYAQSLTQLRSSPRMTAEHLALLAQLSQFGELVASRFSLDFPNPHHTTQET